MLHKVKSSSQRYWLLITVFLFTGCTVMGVNHYDDLFGPEKTQKRIVSQTSTLGHQYLNQVKPIIDNRCVVCHACYDAPCQLKLSSPEGIDRGISNEQVYATRLLAAKPSRLFIDYTSTEHWREQSFKPVLNERDQRPEVNLIGSVFYQSLLLKSKNPLPEQDILGKEYTFTLDRPESCPSIQEFNDYAEKSPHSGMPYGLPAISNDELSTMTNWLRKGAIMAKTDELPQALLKTVAKWEYFLNQDSNKQQLVARYIFEHWFLAHIYFPAHNRDTFFNLVRSYTPPGEPIKRVATRRPYDDPKADRIYYRLSLDSTTLTAKTHLPLALSEQKLSRLKQQFIDLDYAVTELPSYDAADASNPFKTFTAIPLKSRYQFMLDEAQLLIMGFIKGPVCRGQVALNVINDHFWVVFADPTLTSTEEIDEFLTNQQDHLALPAGAESNASVIYNTIKYSNRESNYVKAKTELTNKVFARGDYLTEKLIWQGDDNNDNAVLTVFRHNDSASVVKGFVGQRPKTAWVLDYPLFERIHYLLVAGFDIYGNVGHQLTTRLYMDFLRLEGERNFLGFLPIEKRKETHDYWYRNASNMLTDFLKGKKTSFYHQTDIDYKTDDPQNEFFDILVERLKSVSNKKYTMPESSPLNALNELPASAANIMPEVSFIMLADDNGKHQAYTLIHNNAHYNITSLLDQEKQRAYDEDTMTIVPGLLGNYPQAFWYISAAEQADFMAGLKSLKTEQDYSELKTQYGIRRTNPQFWFYSDLLHDLAKETQGVEYGLFDYNRLENR